MANAIYVNGLSPVRNQSASAFTDQANLYYIAPADTNAYAIGDPVISSGDGDLNGVPGCTLAAAGQPLRGVIVGIGITEGLAPNYNSLGPSIRPAGAQTLGYYAMVCDAPHIVYEVSEPATGTALTSAAIGMNINLLAGANNGFLSGWTINNTGAAVTATLQCRLLGLVRRGGNAFGNGARWHVMINSHELSAGTVGI